MLHFPKALLTIWAPHAGTFFRDPKKSNHYMLMRFYGAQNAAYGVTRDPGFNPYTLA